MLLQDNGDMQAFYSGLLALHLPPGRRFAMEKYFLLCDHLQRDETDVRLVSARSGSDGELAFAHRPDYIAAITEPSRLSAAFRDFPDDLTTIRRQGLAYFRYVLTKAGRNATSSSLSRLGKEEWIDPGLGDSQPIVCEDFLPVSAASARRSPCWLNGRAFWRAISPPTGCATGTRVTR